MSNAWLAHHGIVGQKWGVRRFQNSDGSLTSAGKKRYLNSDSKEKPDFSKMSYDEEKKYAKKKSVEMLKEFRKLYDSLMDSDDEKTEKEYYSKIKKLSERFEADTGYTIDGHGGGSDNKLSIQFSRELQEPDEENDLYYQQWRIHEDDSEPDGYWLEDLDRDWW